MAFCKFALLCYLGSGVVLLPRLLLLLVPAFLLEGDSDGVQYILNSSVCRLSWPGPSEYPFPFTPAQRWHVTLLVCLRCSCLCWGREAEALFF